NSGNVSIKASLFVKANDKYFALPHSNSFNIVVSEGIKDFEVDITSVTLAKNSFVNFGAQILTDLTDKTNLAIEQTLLKIDEQTGESQQQTGEFLKFVVEKEISFGQINYSFKVYADKSVVKEIVGKTVRFDILAYDSFVTIEKIKSNPELYSNYKKTIYFVVTENAVINAEMQFYADGEVVKNENGQDVINTNELESEFIKIGKIGILKINIYPKLNLANDQVVSLSFNNSDNYNLSFKQVKKVGEGYVDVNTSTIVSSGIILDTSYLLNDETEQYLYVKLLTDSPINENSKFDLKLGISGVDYNFEKTLTSVLLSNLEISFDGAVLNSKGNLESVYAKGVSDGQIISLTVNKLTGLVPNFKADISNLKGANFVEILQYRDPVKVGNDSLRYDYIINGLNYVSGEESVEIYFYIDKTVNNKTERYMSNILKLNVVDFVVKGMFVEQVQNGYLTKPVGTSYPLKISLETINNQSSEVLNEIKALEEEISKKTMTESAIKSSTFKFAGENFVAGSDNGDFEILQNEYFEIKPKEAKKFVGFDANFAISYSDGSINVVEEYEKENAIFFDKTYSRSFKSSFGAEFYIQTDINNPVPVYTASEFVSMKQNANYVLMNDIVLQKDENDQVLKNGYNPFVANFNSLDGNGYKVVVKHLDIDLNDVVAEYNFGLFTQIAENALIKNLTVKFDFESVDFENGVIGAKNVLNLQNIANLTFGALCAENLGLVYNCEIQGIKINGQDELLYVNLSSMVGDEKSQALIGGLVGRNNGIITNSRSELKICASKGFVGGFVGENNGTISSSYYKNIIIKNLGEDENSSLSAGFVYSNAGTIKFSFVEGDKNYESDGRYLCDPILADFALTAPTSVAGFVFNNSGEIEDCYANLSITSQSYSGGFVFTNSGMISRCYASTLNEKENNIAHAPFIATKVEIDEQIMKTKIVDCFYLNINKSSVNDNLVVGLTLKQFNDEYYLTNFIFDENDCVWSFLGDNKLPSLVEANHIALSRRSLYKTTETPDGGIKYSYIYADGLYAGSKNNPIIISNEEEFIEYFSISSKTNNQYYRLVNNINFSDYASLSTYNYVFCGRLDGNGLEISNVRISAPANFEGEAFGLFAKIERYKNGSTPIVKNLEIKPLEVYANNAQFVGTLAGVVNNANVVNVSAVGSEVIVQGRNIVGGLIGLACGTSNLVNISSNVSVNSNYSSFAGTNSDGFALFCSYVDENGNLKTNAKDVSYAGAVCGVVDTSKTTTNNERVRNIQVLAGTKSIASFAGFAFGLVCENSGVDNVSVTINSNSYINSNYAGGFVCGENRGYMSRSQTKTEGQILKGKLFKNNCKFAGGIAGFNNNGTVVNSISEVDVVGSAQTIVAGGIVGLSVGGAISSCISSCDVWSNKIVGGIVGFAIRKDMLEQVKVQFNISNLDNLINETDTIQTVKTNNIMYVANCVALNNFGADTINYFDSTDTSHAVGAIIGAGHNTPVVKDGEISVATKNSYITFGNYYKNQTYTKIDEEAGEITFKLQDFGANNVGSFDFGELKRNLGSTNPCGEGVDKLSSAVFKNWSKNVFDISFAEELDKTNLPKLKSVNNINTKALEG
ncbi:MAG: hypothetical protein ACI4TI_03930, partial [Christensenellales bacterium]